MNANFQAGFDRYRDADASRRRELRRAGRAHAGQPMQVRGPRSDERRGSPQPVEEVAREVDDRTPRDARSKHDGQELGLLGSSLDDLARVRIVDSGL